MTGQRRFALAAALVMLLSPAQGLCPYGAAMGLRSRALLQAPACDIAALAEANRQTRPPPPGPSPRDSAEWIIQEVRPGAAGRGRQGSCKGGRRTPRRAAGAALRGAHIPHLPLPRRSPGA